MLWADIHRYIQECTSLPPERVLNKQHLLRTKLLHKFMPAIDVEMTVDYGGTEEQRLLLLNIRCLTDAMSLMVVDHKARIVYATSELAQTLGYPSKTLTELSLANIIPPPYAQLHAGFMKVSGQLFACTYTWVLQQVSHLSWPSTITENVRLHADELS
jgi:hypothetical protein